MKVLFFILILLVAAFIVWIVAMMPAGEEHPYESKFKKYMFAHRGLHSKVSGIPENSIPAFGRAADDNKGIELDVHLTDDGTLAVFHDNSLMRMCNMDVDVTTLTRDQLRSVRLMGTNWCIPTLNEVLGLVAGRVPILVELKVDDNNFADLVDSVMDVMINYKGAFALQSFDPRAIKYLKKTHPQVMRGQLAGYLKSEGNDKMTKLEDFALRNLASSILTRPNFISYRVNDLRKPAITLCRLIYNPLIFAWTVKSAGQFRLCRSVGAKPIFEGEKKQKPNKQ